MKTEGDKVRIRTEKEQYMPEEFHRCFGKIGGILECGDECYRIAFPTRGNQVLIEEMGDGKAIRDSHPDGNVIEVILLLGDVELVE